MTDENPDLTTRGVPRSRFNPLRDVPTRNTADLGGVELEFGDFDGLDDENGDFEPENGENRVLGVVSAVRRQIVALGLAETPEGAMAVTAAEKAQDATGSAAAACLHELRMIMDAIRAAKPVEKAGDATEDVLARMRERKAGA